MSNAAHLLPRRLREAAAAIANARAGRRGAPPIENVLAVVPEDVFLNLVEDATAALDAADKASPAPERVSADPQIRRIDLAASVGLDLAAQAVVLIDIARDGTVHSSSWAEGGGTRSRAIGDWANALTWNHLTAVPFQTAFGMGFDGRPTPLTTRQRGSLMDAQRDYADRNTVRPDAPDAIPRPLDKGDAEALGRALDAGTLLILARDRNGAARGVLWAVSTEAAELAHTDAQAVWTATAAALVRLALPESP